MEISASSIKEMLFNEGIDLVGVANAEELITAYPPRPATALMPTAKSVIVMAVAHSLGAVYSPDIMLWTRNKMQTSRLLDQTAEKLGRILEREGFMSLPVSADKPVEIYKSNPETGKKFPQTRTAGFISIKHAAVSCGMGQMGDNNLLLTPEFGPHQRLCAVITEAELEPDLRRELDLCKGCKKCENACPSGALKDGNYTVDPCFVYWTYGFDKLPPRKISQWPAYFKMLISHLKRRDIMVEYGQTMITDVDNCIECMRVCQVGSRFEDFRPKELPFQKTGGTG